LIGHHRRPAGKVIRPRPARREGDPGRFEDNGFTLVPGTTRAVRFHPEGPVKLKDFRRSLKLHHLRGTYRSEPQSAVGRTGGAPSRHCKT
jgi:hypothetical protein